MFGKHWNLSNFTHLLSIRHCLENYWPVEKSPSNIFLALTPIFKLFKTVENLSTKNSCDSAEHCFHGIKIGIKIGNRIVIFCFVNSPGGRFRKSVTVKSSKCTFLNQRYKYCHRLFCYEQRFLRWCLNFRKCRKSKTS